MSKVGAIYLTMAGSLFLPALAYFVMTQMKLDKNLQILILIVSVALGAVISANLTDEED